MPYGVCENLVYYYFHLIYFQDVTFSIESDENQQIYIFGHAISAEIFNFTAQATFVTDDSVTENISHASENIDVQVINMLNENEVGIEEANGSDVESDTDSDYEIDDEHENANDEEHFQIDPLQEQPNLHIDGYHHIDEPIGHPNS